MAVMTPDRSPFELLRAWLEEDRHDGIPWEPEQFAYTAWLACRECRAWGWLRPIIETYPAWKAAWHREPGRCANLTPALLDAISNERHDINYLG